MAGAEHCRLAGARSGVRAAAIAIAALALAAVATGWPEAARAGDPPPERRHALSLLGEPKYGRDFQHFGWVKPDAPKGGAVRLRSIGSFDTLNGYARKGEPASGLALVTAYLMVPSLEEPSTEYALVAEWASYPDDFSSVTFGIRREARFDDGKPVTPEDVVFSMEALKAANSRYALYYKNVVKAEKTGERQVTFTFDAAGNRELPQIVGGLPVLPKHWWQGKDANGEPRGLDRGTMEVPVGAGPYRVKSVDPGRTITYQRVKDWWAKDLPVARGQYNFDEITFVSYRDRTPAFEAFKIGQTDFWPESSAKAWATGYDVEAVKKGFIKRELIESRHIAGMQGFVFNIRRKQLGDRRVRSAFDLAFNFEWANKNMFFDQYKRIESYFDNSELRAAGMPDAAELAILEQVRGKVPDEVFTTPYKTPFNATVEDFRRNMNRAAKLLADAGWQRKDGVLANAAGERLTAELLLVQPDFERLALAYKSELEKLGIRLDIRTVDSAQYQRRRQTFDFDIIVASFGQSHSPGNEQREYWGSAAAGQEGSSNLAGIKDPAIDTLIERLIFARDRADLVAATRALDRVLLWNHFVVPQFYAPHDRIAVWDKFGRPDKPAAGYAGTQTTFHQTWWWDAAAARKLEEARAR